MSVGLCAILLVAVKNANSHAFFSVVDLWYISFKFHLFMCYPLYRTTANLEIGEKNTFHTHIIYDDSETFKVISAATEVLGWCI